MASGGIEEKQRKTIELKLDDLSISEIYQMQRHIRAVDRSLGKKIEGERESKVMDEIKERIRVIERLSDDKFTLEVITSLLKQSISKLSGEYGKDNLGKLNKKELSDKLMFLRIDRLEGAKKAHKVKEEVEDIESSANQGIALWKYFSGEKVKSQAELQNLQELQDSIPDPIVLFKKVENKKIIFSEHEEKYKGMLKELFESQADESEGYSKLVLIEKIIEVEQEIELYKKRCERGNQKLFLHKGEHDGLWGALGSATAQARSSSYEEVAGEETNVLSNSDAQETVNNPNDHKKDNPLTCVIS